MKKRIAIIGAGASGVFAAIRCGEIAKQSKQSVEIKVFEASASPLRKVSISGGGRCNVTHHQYNPREFCFNYPRGSRELLSPFQQFQAEDTVNWFKERGVRLKFESDGRMFPVTDKSQTIINCLLKEVDRYGIEILKKKKVQSLKKLPNGEISLYINDDESFVADSVLISSGSSPIGYRLAKQLGHSISELAPSLFTFKIEHPLLKEMAGTSFENSHLKLKIEGKKEFTQTGALLITHWGLSGPALLKLSAWAAREMMHAKYQAKLIVNWTGISKESDLLDLLRDIRNQNSKASVANAFPPMLTKKFWKKLLEVNEISVQKKWGDVSKKEINRLIELLFRSQLNVSGKSRFKDEFVECGGVNLKEIDFKTMQSKICNGLFFAGEVMDVDGITGGFNFQNAWTSGWIAGSHLAKDSSHVDPV